MILDQFIFKIILLFIPANASLQRKDVSYDEYDIDYVRSRLTSDSAEDDAEYYDDINYDEDDESYSNLLNSLCERRENSTRSSSIVGMVKNGVRSKISFDEEKRLESAVENDFLNQSQHLSNSDNYESFICEDYGVFPDDNNVNMFWHCVHPLHGKGFIVRHIKCPAGLQYNPSKKESDENDNKTKVEKRPLMKPYSKKEPTVSETFRCEHYGLFPDESTASMFWFCDRNEDGLTVSKMMCPENHIFDRIYKECMLQQPIIDWQRLANR